MIFFLVQFRSSVLKKYFMNLSFFLLFTLYSLEVGQVTCSSLLYNFKDLFAGTLCQIHYTQKVSMIFPRFQDISRYFKCSRV